MITPKAYAGNKPYIFLSYAHKDKNIVFPFIIELQKHAYVWFDEGITPGVNYKDNIINHISGCVLFLFFVTEESLQSQFCRKEIEFANKKDKIFINILPYELELPDWFEFDYGMTEHFYLSKYPKGTEVDELVKKTHDLLEPCLIPLDSQEKDIGYSKDKRYNALKDWAMTQDYITITAIQNKFQIDFKIVVEFVTRLKEEKIIDGALTHQGYRVLKH